ncbi:MAG: peptidylprolyl isomerase [Pseudomonadota bacterium]
MRCLFCFFALISAGSILAQEPTDIVFSDGDAQVTRAEFKAILSTTTPALREAAANDVGDRFELINGILSTRKLAKQADQLPAGSTEYWDLYFQLTAAKASFVFEKLLREYDFGDPGPLAGEYYLTQKDKYALIPEERLSSHILIGARPGLDRTSARALATELINQLEAGADWEQLVTENSDDPGSAERGGLLDKYITQGDPTITPPYSDGLFKIKDVGGFIQVESQFGVHVIRLDDIKPKSYKPFREVSEAIVKDIRAEQRRLALAELKARYQITDDAFIDGNAMEELFAPYRSE